MNKEKVISIHGLTKCFGEFTAVDHISFEVEQGEIFGFLGANGAGKTTAMRMLCGLSRPSSGFGKVAGCDINKEGEKIKCHIGYMGQHFSLYEDLTVEENIRLFGSIYSVGRTLLNQRMEDMLERMGMSSLRHVLVGDLPLGWKQKLAFITATLHHPSLLFLDEPTGGVDPIARRQFWEIIYEAANEGTTIFVTTHYMDEAEYCNRIAIMIDGKLKVTDTPGHLKQEFQVDDIDELFTLLARGTNRT